MPGLVLLRNRRRQHKYARQGGGGEPAQVPPKHRCGPRGPPEMGGHQPLRSTQLPEKLEGQRGDRHRRETRSDGLHEFRLIRTGPPPDPRCRPGTTTTILLPAVELASPRHGVRIPPGPDLREPREPQAVDEPQPRSLEGKVEPDTVENVVLRGAITALGGLPKSGPRGGAERTPAGRGGVGSGFGPRRDGTAHRLSRGTEGRSRTAPPSAPRARPPRRTCPVPPLPGGVPGRRASSRPLRRQW